MLTGRPLAQRRAPLHLKDTVLGYDLKRYKHEFKVSIKLKTFDSSSYPDYKFPIGTRVTYKTNVTCKSTVTFYWQHNNHSRVWDGQLEA